MTPLRTPTRRALAAAAIAACSLVATGLAHAESHALILWIGDYADPRNNLPGIDKDAAIARQIALAMGVPDRNHNIKEVSNAGLTKAAVASALSELTNRIAQDDKVFIYYSGHGAQIAGIGGARCTEGMVTREPDLFDDSRLQNALTTLGRKTSQLVMMNDSCFSGGAATKDLRSSSGSDDFKPKFYSGPLPAGAAVTGDAQCGEAVNKMSRNLEAVAAAPRAPQVLYIAASAANEVSIATSNGSLATLAWAHCLKAGDADRSGAVDGDELRACAQSAINNLLKGTGRSQTITMVGNTKLPLTFATAGGTPGAALVQAVRTLENIRAMRDPAHSVTLSAARQTLRINQDELDFNVTSSREGYLYVLHVGSDGKTFDMLFPNANDRNNRINAGTHALPRPNWRVKAAGPAGTSRLMALVSSQPLNLTKDMDLSSLFPHAEASADGAKNLVAAAAGSSDRAGRIGVSEIVSFRETN